MAERRRGWVLLLLHFELPVAPTQCPWPAWSLYLVIHNMRSYFRLWIGVLLPAPFPKAWLALGGEAMSPRRAAAAEGKTQVICLFTCQPSQHHTNIDRLCGKMRRATRQQCLGCCQPVRRNSCLQTLLGLLRVYLALRRLIHCNPPLHYPYTGHQPCCCKEECS